MSTVFAVANQKGGVGKTTTAVNVAAWCAWAGKTTLVIDGDVQGNASSVLCLAPPDDDHAGSVYRDAEPQATRVPLLSVVPAGQDLAAVDQHPQQRDAARSRLHTRIAGWREAYEYIFIDCPPHLGAVCRHALLAADRVLVPLQCEYFALEGLSQLVGFIDMLRTDLRASVTLGAILLTMCDAEHALARDVVSQVQQHFPRQALRSVIPRDMALAAAPSHGHTIVTYDPTSPGGLAYLAATKEILHGLA
jgi:chromosome partitioning protein